MAFTYRKTACMLWTTLRSVVAQEGLATRPPESVLMLSTRARAALQDTRARKSFHRCQLPPKSLSLQNGSRF